MRVFDLTEDQAISFITIACDFGVTQVGETLCAAERQCGRAPASAEGMRSGLLGWWEMRVACGPSTTNQCSSKPKPSHWPSHTLPAVDGNFGVHAICPKEPFGYPVTTKSTGTGAAAAPAPAPVPASSGARGAVAGALTLLAAAAAAGALLA